MSGTSTVRRMKFSSRPLWLAVTMVPWNSWLVATSHRLSSARVRAPPWPRPPHATARAPRRGSGRQSPPSRVALEHGAQVVDVPDVLNGEGADHRALVRCDSDQSLYLEHGHCLPNRGPAQPKPLRE